MKTFRFIGMALTAVLMSFSLASCGGDDENDDYLTTAEIDGIVYSILGSTAYIYTQSSTLSGSIVIPETVSYKGKKYTVSVEDGAFMGTLITSVKLPDNTTALGVGCFMQCYQLKSVTLPDNIKSLGQGCFQSCSNLTSIDLPESITVLGNYCFSNCSSLSKVTCEWTNLDDVTTGSQVFHSINSACTLYVPKGTKSIYEAKEPWCDFNNIVEQ